MGTRINVLFDHQLDDYRDREAVLKRLSQASPEALAVQDYWAGGEGTSQSAKTVLQQWTADPEIALFSFHSYTGPGSLFVSVNGRMAKIRTGGRWRGFLSIPDLYAVHLKAFRAIAAALGATTMIYFPDNDDLFELFWDDKKLDECIKTLEDTAGPPQSSIDAVSAEISAETEHHVPDVWYMSQTVAV